jgi:plasmid replication initiation protein
MKKLNRSKESSIVRGEKPELSSSGIFETEEDRGDYKVTMDNALVRAAHRLTLKEKRIVALAIAKTDSRSGGLSFLEREKIHKALNLIEMGVNEEQAKSDMESVFIPTTRISAAEYAETYDVDIQTAYEALREGASALFERKITFWKDHGTPKKQILRKTEMRWVSQIEYVFDEGAVELKFFPPLISYLKGLKGNFTTYKLARATALRSIYSWRLLELLQSHLKQDKPTSNWIISVEEFALSIGAPKGEKTPISYLMKFIIKPSINELLEKDQWVIRLYPQKSGRRISKLHFEFWRDAQIPLSL